MLAGSVPKLVTKLLYGANLCATFKKDGSLRPIAVGGVFHSLVPKCCSHFCRERTVFMFAPQQLGFDVRNDCEILAYADRIFTFLYIALHLKR